MLVRKMSPTAGPGDIVRLSSRVKVLCQFGESVREGKPVEVKKRNGSLGGGAGEEMRVRGRMRNQREKRDKQFDGMLDEEGESKQCVRS